jgi:hypothetical protein
MKYFSSLFYALKKSTRVFFNRRFDRFLKKRMPSNTKHTLTNRNIFILPTRFGFAYLIFIVLLFLLGTNYQNNTILLLSYLLASLFITVMIHSFYNLSRLTILSGKKQFTFANQQALFPINIQSKKRHFDLNFQFVGKSLVSNVIRLDQCDASETDLLLPCLAKKRGIYDLGRVKMQSEYPLGLFKTWSMLDFAHKLVVFPQPKGLGSINNYLTGFDESSQSSYLNSSNDGIDEFSELRNHIVGESLARIAWKQLARGQGKLSKHYQSQEGALLWLKLKDMPSNDIEEKLSFLSFLILEYGKTNREYGLFLNGSSSIHDSGLKIMPSSGYQHQQNCLIALASFDSNSIRGIDGLE